MTSLPDDDYVNTCKIIETFGTFFEKLSITSGNPTRNLQDLLEFKQILYNNLGSQAKLLSSLHSVYGDLTIPSQDITSTPPQVSKASYDEHFSKFSSQTSPQESASQKPKSNSQSDVDSAPEKLEGRQMPSQDGFSDKQQQDNKVLLTEYISISQLMPRIKAASHNEIAKLFSLGTTYSNARVFGEHQCPVLAAVCFCFFEKMLCNKAKDTQNVPAQTLEIQLNNDPELYSMRGTELFGFMKGLLQNYSEAEVGQKLYEHAAANPKVYKSTLTTFKKLILENLPRRIKTPEVESFDWMNDIDTVEPALLHGLTRLFRVSIRFFVLTRDQLVERVVNADSSLSSRLESPRDQAELTIFYDRNLNNSYILYPIHKPSEDRSKSPISQRLKTRPSINNNNPIEPKLTKAHSTDPLVGILPTLETVSSTPVISLNEADVSSDTRPSHKADPNHLPEFRDSYSTPMARGVTIPGRPSFEKGVHTSPRSGNKEIRFHHARDLEALEERLTPKEKDTVPPRPSAQLNSHVEEEKFNRILSEKSRNENNRQNYSPFKGTSAQKMGKDDGKVFVFGRSATQEYGTGSSSAGLRLKAEMLGQRAHHVAEVPVKNPVKITKVPSSLQTTLDKVNQISNQCDEEFDGLVNKYLKKEANIGDNAPKKALALLTISYRNIIGQNNKENIYHRAMTGPY